MYFPQAIAAGGALVATNVDAVGTAMQFWISACMGCHPGLQAELLFRRINAGNIEQVVE